VVVVLVIGYFIILAVKLGVRLMSKGDSIFSDIPWEQAVTTDYEYVKSIVAVAKKNGWDLQGLGLIPKDAPRREDSPLNKKQAAERDRLVKSILQRFSKVLTPPVPLDLEQCIRNKDEGVRLPWEQEVMEKVDQWRDEITKIKPLILKELGRAHARTAEL
jgi:hypothetical protein